MSNITDNDLHYLRQARQVIADRGCTYSSYILTIIIRKLLDIINKLI